MEIPLRKKMVPLQDQENIAVGKTKNMLPKRNLGTTRALEDVSNLNIQRQVVAGKGTKINSDIERKPSLREKTRSNYSHIQPKINTGLHTKPSVPSNYVRPSLRREESTAAHALKAAVRNKVTLVQKDKNLVNEVASNGKKDSNRRLVKTNKVEEEKVEEKKVEPTESIKIKETIKEETASLKKLQLLEPELDTEAPTLPPDIEDIDTDQDPLLLSIYMKDICHYLKALENKYAIEYDFLRDQEEINGKMRSTLINWMISVQHGLSFLLETYQLSVGIVDQYLQITKNLPRGKLQLIGATALFIASKYEEVYIPPIEDFVFVTDSSYSKDELLQCERDILTKLGFCLARPIPLYFCRRYNKVAKSGNQQHHLTKYFVDLSLVEYSMAHYKPSELSAAGVCLSLYILSEKKQSLNECWTPTLSYYSGYSLSQIFPIMCKIARIVINADKSQNKACYKMYLSSSCARVAGLPQLKSPRMLQLVYGENL